jgi:hypothetical protein
LGTVAEVLTMCCFFDKYWRGVGSYKKKTFFSFLDLLGAVAKVLTMRCFSGGYGVGSYESHY